MNLVRTGKRGGGEDFQGEKTFDGVRNPAVGKEGGIG